jgi:hypothetical protein
MKKSTFTSMKLSILILLFISFSIGKLQSQDLNPTNWPNLVGYWKFQDTTDLTHATVGNDLMLIGQHSWLAGPSVGDTAIRIDTGSYYKVYHGIAANGGGDSVNRYSLMFDFRVLNFDRWHSFFQTDTTNQNDGDCFIKKYPDSIPGTIGVGFTGYSNDSINPNQWYRLVISVNLGNYYRYYLNGVLILDGDTDDIAIDDRFALTEAILFFADNNQEDDTIDVASLAIFDTCLTAAQIAQIGSIDPCVANPPIVSLGNDTTICGADSLVLTINSGYESYLWSTGDTTSQIVLDSSNFGVTSDTIWAMATDINNCQTTDSMLLSFAKPPHFYMPTDTLKCSDMGDTIFNFSIDSTFDSYLWSSGDTTWSISIYTASLGVGVHTIWAKVTDFNNCTFTDSMNLTIAICGSIEEINPTDFKVYPNPNKGTFVLELNKDASLISIYNETGQKIKEIQNLSTGKHHLNLSDLSPGLYYMNIRGDGYNSYRKIIIQ